MLLTVGGSLIEMLPAIQDLLRGLVDTCLYLLKPCTFPPFVCLSKFIGSRCRGVCILNFNHHYFPLSSRRGWVWNLNWFVTRSLLSSLMSEKGKINNPTVIDSQLNEGIFGRWNEYFTYHGGNLLQPSVVLSMAKLSF